MGKSFEASADNRRAFYYRILWPLVVFFTISVAVLYMKGVKDAKQLHCNQMMLTAGQYSLDEGENFIPYEDIKNVQTIDSESLILECRPGMAVNKDEKIYIYSSNMNIKIFVNDTLCYWGSSDKDDPWTELTSPGIDFNDRLRIELKTNDKQLFNACFRKLFNNIYVTTRYDLLLYQFAKNGAHIIACVFCVILGLAIFLSRFSIGRFNEYNTEGLIACAMLLICGGITCFNFYDYITLISKNLVMMKYFDTLAQSFTFIFMTGYVRRYIHNSKMKRVSFVLTNIMVALIVLYSISQMFVSDFVRETGKIFEWLVAGGIVFGIIQIVFLTMNLTKSTIEERIVFASVIILAAGISFEMIYYVLTGEYIVKAMLLSLTVFAGIQYILITKYFYETGREAEKARRLENELTENQIKMMLSQIQPHFLYNALGTIRALCTRNPEEARNAMDHFARYLRANMDSLNERWCIPFKKELEHVNSYLYIEKLRFGDLLNIEYDIQAENFEIPPLTLQTMVENAVKHGLLVKKEGGTVKISTRETADCYEIKVEDTGVGFDASDKKKDDGRSHIGVANTRQRIMGMCNGSLNIASKVGEGTTITILIPKNN